jgi:GTP pyrophosphokinase
MAEESIQDVADLRFLIAVRDVTHLNLALKNLKRTASVLNVRRTSTS